MQNGKPAASYILMRALLFKRKMIQEYSEQLTSYHINDKNKSNYNDDDDDDDDKSNSNNNLQGLAQEPHCSYDDLSLGSYND